jgi:hypothetical protein
MTTGQNVGESKGTKGNTLAVGNGRSKVSQQTSLLTSTWKASEQTKT